MSDTSKNWLHGHLDERMRNKADEYFRSLVSLAMIGFNAEAEQLFPRVVAANNVLLSTRSNVKSATIVIPSAQFMGDRADLPDKLHVAGDEYFSKYMISFEEGRTRRCFYYFYDTGLNAMALMVLPKKKEYHFEFTICGTPERVDEYVKGYVEICQQLGVRLNM